MRDRDAVGGQPPGAAAGQRSDPHVVFGHEGQQIAMEMGITRITGHCHVR
jgi:hypothetical protein